MGRSIIKDGYFSRLEHWNEYIRLNTELPKVASENSGQGNTGTPFLQHLRTTLITRCNYNPETVMRTPYLQAMWDYLASWEIEGVCDIYDEGFLGDIAELDATLGKKARELHAKTMKDQNGNR